MPCPYADIFGKAKTGVHSIRIFDLSVVDTLLTVIAAYLTAESLKINFWVSFSIWFITGEILHYIFGVKTGFLEKIGLTPNCD